MDEKFKTATRSGYRLSVVGAAPPDVQLRAIFLKHGHLYRKHGKRNHGAPQWAWTDDCMELSRNESALVLACLALRCFFISTPGATD
jgi:hypothetical protein